MFLRSTPTRIAVSNFGLPPPSNMKKPYSPLLHEFPCTRLLVNEIHDKAMLVHLLSAKFRFFLAFGQGLVKLLLQGLARM